MKPPLWTRDDDVKGRRLWRQGKHASEIGALLGRSKNSVIGRAYRENWGMHPNPFGRGRTFQQERKARL